MKSKKIKILEEILRWMCIIVLKKYNPTVIGITGSVGKTSARDAIFLVLSENFRVRKSRGNYNNEIGIPLTVIGAKSGGSSLFGWVRVLFHWFFVLIFPVEYPEVLVLEMSIDRPGDMTYLMSFIPVDIGVVTTLSNAHVEFFRDIEQIAKEKGILIASLPQGGVAVLNADDKRVSAMDHRTNAMVLRYGCAPHADVHASGIMLRRNGNDASVHFKVNHEGRTVPVRLPHVIATHQVPSVLAALTVGIALKLNLVEMAHTLKSYVPPEGRMRRLVGINHTTIIDDTYNASPKAMRCAIDTLKDLTERRSIAVLGDMLELGENEKEEHENIAESIFEKKIDLFFAVGERMETAYHVLREKGFPQDKLFYFEDPTLAGQKVQQILRTGDIVLVKGSQGMRMEKVVEKFLAATENAGDLLCRQSKSWKAKPFVKP